MVQIWAHIYDTHIHHMYRYAGLHTVLYIVYGYKEDGHQPQPLEFWL